MYFVHSYEFIPEDKNVISATTDYSSKIVCSIEKEIILSAAFIDKLVFFSKLDINNYYILIM